MRDTELGKKYTFESLKETLHFSTFKFQSHLNNQKVIQPITPGVVTSINFRKGKSRTYQWFPQSKSVSIGMYPISLIKKALAPKNVPPLEPKEEEDEYLKELEERQVRNQINHNKRWGR